MPVPHVVTAAACACSETPGPHRTTALWAKPAAMRPPVRGVPASAAACAELPRQHTPAMDAVSFHVRGHAVLLRPYRTLSIDGGGTLVLRALDGKTVFEGSTLRPLGPDSAELHGDGKPQIVHFASEAALGTALEAWER